jgi:hypothetical protein
VMPPSSKDKEKKEEGSSKSKDEDQKSGEMVNPLPSNPTVQFFAQLFRDYVSRPCLGDLQSKSHPLYRGW